MSRKTVIINQPFLNLLLVLVLYMYKAEGFYDDNFIPNQCPQLFPRNFVGYAPRGNLTAGNYTEKPKLKGLKQCVIGCCTSNVCNVVFIHETTCYHIECSSNELCLPLLRAESVRLVTHVEMILVKPVLDDESWSDILDQANYGSDISNGFTFSNEDVNNVINGDRTEDLLPEGSALDFVKYVGNRDRGMLTPFRENIPVGKQPFIDSDAAALNQYLDKTDRDLMIEASNYLNDKLLTCEVGIDTQCPKNEECVAVVTKNRNGVCKCKPGYGRNSNRMCDELDSYNLEMDSKKNKPSHDVSALNIVGDSNDPLKQENDVVKDLSTEPSIKKLMVSAISKEVQLPENVVTLSAYTVPDEKTSNDHYNYMWTLVEQPKGGLPGNMKQNGATVTLSQLTEGNYRFKVAVNATTTNSYGEAFANVTVLPAKRINQPPAVVITPSSQTVKLPNMKAVLDGGMSKDDDAIISWHWELISGPLGYQPPLPDGPTLQLSDLKTPGNYTFKLTIEDSDHVKNSTTANITVLNHTDYPPEANAGEDVIIYLPKNNLTLNGSLSSDDHEITTWEWTKSAADENKAVDMQNTHSPYLQLSNLSEGVYTFVLKVTDSSGQSSTAEVHVFVKPPTNTPPIAVAGKHQYISLPQTWVTLNGSESSDDHRIVAYTWKTLSGPTNASFTRFNESMTNVTGLTKGEYELQLTVLDDNGNSATDVVNVTVTQNKNSPPKANAGGDQVITLPAAMVVLNGSSSSDDLGIATWTWSRQQAGLAAGNIVENSDKGPVLLLTDLVPGRYIFELTVADEQGATDTDTVSLQVKPDPLLRSLLEMTVNAPASVFTGMQLESLLKKLKVMLQAGLEMNITGIRSDEVNGDAQIVFYVFDKSTDPVVILGGPAALSAMRSAIRASGVLVSQGSQGNVVGVSHLRELVCQNACSGRGVCDQRTRKCRCDAFWMQNPFTSFMVDAEPNCDWSLVYALVTSILMFGSIALTYWWMRRLCTAPKAGVPRSTQRVPRSSRAPARRSKYQLLGGDDEVTAGKMSFSETETDSDVLFESRKKDSSISMHFTNGHAGEKSEIRNGFSKSGRRIKT